MTYPTYTARQWLGMIALSLALTAASWVLAIAVMHLESMVRI